MNRSMPPRDCGNQRAASGRPSGSGRVVSGTGGLVCGAEGDPEAGIEKARRGESRAGVWEQSEWVLGDRVEARAVLPLGRRNFDSHLLAQGAGQEPPDRMRLPSGGFHKFLTRCSSLALEQGEHGCRLAAVAHALRVLGHFGRLLRAGWLVGRRRFLGRSVGRLFRRGRVSARRSAVCSRVRAPRQQRS